MIADDAINTHEKVRNFQNRLYLTAKADRKKKFYAMYDKIYRKDILIEAWKRVKANGGAGGIDKVSIEDVKAYGENKLLCDIVLFAKLFDGSVFNLNDAEYLIFQGCLQNT